MASLRRWARHAGAVGRPPSGRGETPRPETKGAVSKAPSACIALIDATEVPSAIFCRTTNLIERSFEEERRRTKVMPRFTDERSAMKLVFAALIRCSQRWNRASITDIERHQLKLLRAELEIDPPPESKGGPLEKEDRVTQVAASIRRSGLDRAAVRAEYLAAVAHAV